MSANLLDDRRPAFLALHGKPRQVQREELGEQLVQRGLVVHPAHENGFTVGCVCDCQIAESIGPLAAPGRTARRSMVSTLSMNTE